MLIVMPWENKRDHTSPRVSFFSPSSLLSPSLLVSVPLSVKAARAHGRRDDGRGKKQTSVRRNELQPKMVNARRHVRCNMQEEKGKQGSKKTPWVDLKKLWMQETESEVRVGDVGVEKGDSTDYSEG
jgi:hypothetical protein